MICSISHSQGIKVPFPTGLRLSWPHILRRNSVSILSRDLRFSFRALLRRPAVPLVAIATLGLAIGSTTAMFSVINAVLLKPLNFDDPDKVAIIWESNPKAGLDIFTASPANFNDWQAQNSVFSSISAY